VSELAIRVVSTRWGYVGLLASGRGLERVSLPLPSRDDVQRELACAAAAVQAGPPGRRGEPARSVAGGTAGGGGPARVRSRADGGQEAFLDRAEAWLQEYCRSACRTHPVPVEDLAWERVPGFTGRVLRLLPAIPPGETLTYGQVAARLGSPRAARAVGRACAANPWPLLLPCHRVVACRDLGGYAGGRELKEALLAWERRSR
jgi:methylated-DNA-[protein]-cysteine S-methyltransferase